MEGFDMNLSLLGDYRRDFEAIEASVYQDLAKVIAGNESVLKDFLENKQLFDKGQDSFGMALIPSYASSTIAAKKKKGQPTNRVTLKDTGDFYNSISITVSGQQMIIQANVSYTSYLLDRYGKQVFGIQPRNLKYFLEQYYIPAFKESYDRIISQ